MMSDIRSVHGLYGVPTTVTSVAPRGSKPAAPGGMDYVGLVLCQANGNTCKARPITGQDLCIGHQRQLDKLEALEQKARQDQ